VTRRELLAVIDAFKHWRHYVSGNKTVVRSDTSSLTWLKNFKQPEGELARWLERLAEFDIELQYRRGCASGNSDGLSRRPCDSECKYCERKEVTEVIRCNLIGFDRNGIDWLQEQEKDATLSRVRNWVDSGTLPEWEEVSSDTNRMC
jgi:hypothetical protein